MFRPILPATLALAAGLAGAAAPTAVEYYHGGYGHYFVTASPQEIAALDAGSPAGWRRTGHAFDVFPLGAPGAAHVCRFWSGQTFTTKSSHFYDAALPRCATGAIRDWKFEGEVFGVALPDAAGECGWGTKALYRLYNDGRSGAPNHRYTTSLAVRADMLAQGWIAEGAGIGVVGCVPLPRPEAFTIVAAGDIAQCSNAPASLSAAAQTAALVTDDDALVLTLGDNVYDAGAPGEFASCFDPTWGAFRDRIRPAIGNHEYRTPGAEGYFGYFGARAGPDRGGYYSFDHGGWHFIALNSAIDTSVGSPQYQWLMADLAASSATLCTIAYWHHPAFSSGDEHGGDDRMLPMFAALHAAGVEIVLAGHEHFYERFAPQDAQGVRDPGRGVRQFIVGTGGARLYPFGPPHPASEFRHNASHGVLRLALGADGYRWHFVPTGGAAPRDPGSAACHR
ncbi:MAG: hypothetical protein BroJett026_32030 [Betaproteobacteria bacterium]|nr:MAG: hypothetical protein BroJett026_32030 [Betaproteobacteria bacterium]